MRDSAQSLRPAHPHSESMHPLSNTGTSFKKSATEALTHTLPDLSCSVDSKHSQDSLVFSSTEQRQTDLYGSASETVVVSPDPLVSQGQMPNQQVSEASLLVPSDQQLSLSANHGWHPSPDSALAFAWPVPPFLDHPPTGSTGASQITVSPGGPVELSIFDWNSIPNPLVESTISTSTCHLPSLTYSEGSFLGCDRSIGIGLCPRLRPRSLELRAS